jgi:predicted dehydrogenase
MAASNALRVGLIGAGGRWGPWAHVPALQNLPEATMYAVCTAHADTAQAAADKYGVKHAYSDVKTMCTNPDVEAALVAVRVPAHYSITKDALEGGKHVYCEWPLGANTREAEELAALARKKKPADDGGTAAACVARLHVHARADPRRLCRRGAVGQHDAHE